MKKNKINKIKSIFVRPATNNKNLKFTPVSKEELKKTYDLAVNMIETGQTKFEKSKETTFWNDDNVIKFVNWYLKIHKLNPKYYLENKTFLDSFKIGESYEDWEDNYID